MRKANGTVICNNCGRTVQEPEQISRMEFLHIEKQWGYFSAKDGTKQEFDVCEECYDKWISSFQIPAEEQEIIEFV